MHALSTYRNMPSEKTTQADLDFLAQLTGETSLLGPLSPSANGKKSPPSQGGQKKASPGGKRKMAPRDGPVDALLLSAVLAGSGPVTRHHFGHGASRMGAYASCDESRPTTPGAPAPPKVILRSSQAPRSERLRLEREARKEEEAKGTNGTNGTKQRNSNSGVTSPTSPSLSPTTKPARRMSIDPAPISQLLKRASPAANHFHGLPQPVFAAPTTFAQPGAPSTPTRPQVKCMARTRIPTPHGELFLHLYHNSADQKEHLAIVIDPIQLDDHVRAAAPKGRKAIRSRTLDAQWREGETDMERVVRGAYVGRLLPGSEGTASTPPSKSAENGLSAVDEEEQEADILPLVRIHSECFTGETIGSMRCDCGEQLDEALRQIASPQVVPDGTQAASAPGSTRGGTPLTTPSHSVHAHERTVPGRGVVIYMRQEGRGIGLLEKIRTYNLQDLGHDTVTANLMLGHGADERNYAVAAEILRDLGLAGDDSGGGIRLLTNNPEKVEGLAAEKIKVSERVGMVPRDWACRHNSPRLGPTHLADDEKEYGDWRLRRAGVGLIGAGAARGPELEKYLRTKVERMGHMIDIPDDIEGLNG